MSVSRASSLAAAKPALRARAQTVIFSVHRYGDSTEAVVEASLGAEPDMNAVDCTRQYSFWLVYTTMLAYSIGQFCVCLKLKVNFYYFVYNISPINNHRILNSSNSSV